MSTFRYQELDALRGLAALMVVFFHFTLGRPEANYGFYLGTTGVDLFFIISGFVIFMSLTKVNNSTDFIINRVCRLYPTYWTCVTFTFVLISLISILHYGNFDHINFLYYLVNLTMFQYYFHVPDLDGPYWTMIIEMIFYIGILLIFHFKLIKYLNVIGITLSIFVVAETTFLNNQFVQKTLLWIPLLQYIPLFLAGTIFYKIHTNNNKRIENYIILVICLTSQILLYNYSGRSKAFISNNEYAIMLILYFTLFVLFVNGKLKFIVSRSTLFLGKISFALYLVHQYISKDFLIPILTTRLHINFWISAILITLPIVITIASLITFLIEIPMSKRMKEKLRASVVWLKVH